MGGDLRSHPQQLIILSEHTPDNVLDVLPENNTLPLGKHMGIATIPDILWAAFLD